MRAVWKLVSIGWLAFAATASAHVRHRPESIRVPGGAAALPLERCGDLLFTRVTIDGEGPFRMLIDTGAEVTVLSPASAEILPGAGRETGQVATGSGGRAQDIRAWRRIASMAAGDVEWSRFDAAVLDLDAIGEAAGGGLDGILGYAAFQGVLLTLDYPRGYAIVRAGELPPPDGEEILELASRARPYVSLKAGERYIQALIDTGATAALSLPDLGGLSLRAPPVPVGRSVGVGGATDVRAARLAGDLALGRYVLSSPIVQGSSKGGRLGGALLRHFQVTFDAARRRVEFVRKEDGPIAFPPLRGLGVALSRRDGAWYVEETYAPADDCPLRPGDRITEVEGKTVSDLGCARFSMFEDRETIAVALLRGGKKETVAVPVRTLVP